MFESRITFDIKSICLFFFFLHSKGECNKSYFLVVDNHGMAVEIKMAAGTGDN